jgi:8-oxo-dGTP diphosphatase
VIDRPSSKRPLHTIDVVVLSQVPGELRLLVHPTSETLDRWLLPWSAPIQKELLHEAAARLITKALNRPPTWIEQIGAFGDGTSHPAEAEISVGYVGAVSVSSNENPEGGFKWVPIESAPAIPARQQAMVESGLERVQSRLDQSPVAFRFLPSTFTLSELQHTYELLLGKRLHKASFRRALQAAWLVEPLDEWRSEGRGRPAQLYRYSPKRRRRGRRGVRFDFLSV